MGHSLVVETIRTLSSTMTMFVPSDRIACLQMQRGNVMIATITFDQRQVCT